MIKLDSDVILSKKVLIPTGIIVSLIIIIMVVAGIFGNKKDPMEYIFQLNARVTNLSKTIRSYNKYLSSSDLSSYSTALSSNLTGITSSLSATTASEEYKNLNKDTTSSITASETEQNANLNNTLENARLNANLDKVYAEQMASQITGITSLEQSIISETEDANLKSSLGRSASNLTTLYNNFANF